METNNKPVSKNDKLLDFLLGNAITKTAVHAAKAYTLVFVTNKVTDILKNKVEERKVIYAKLQLEYREAKNKKDKEIVKEFKEWLKDNR